MCVFKNNQQINERQGMSAARHRNMKCLKAHLPHHKRDQVLNLTSDIMAGGHLEDIELRQQAEKFLHGLEAQA